MRLFNKIQSILLSLLMVMTIAQVNTGTVYAETSAVSLSGSTSTVTELAFNAGDAAQTLTVNVEDCEAMVGQYSDKTFAEGTTASVSGTTVTVTPGNTAGYALVTVSKDGLDSAQLVVTVMPKEEEGGDSPSMASESDADFTISNASELKEFRDNVNSNYSNYIGKTILLTADIDLNNEEWTPILAGQGNKGLTFDGGNHTISNLKITSDGKNVGLFGTASSSTIKNLTIDGATVTGINHVAVIAGDGLCGHFINCTVKNATITTSVKKDDDGDKAGAICGYLSGESDAEVTNCSAENVKVYGYRDIGGMVGYANGTASVTGNTITNSYVYCDLKTYTGNYKDYATDAAHDANQVIGETSSEATVSNNSVTNVNVIFLRPTAEVEVQEVTTDEKTTIENNAATAAGSNLSDSEKTAVTGAVSNAVTQVASNTEVSKADTKVADAVKTENSAIITAANNKKGSEVFDSSATVDKQITIKLESAKVDVSTVTQGATSSTVKVDTVTYEVKPIATVTTTVGSETVTQTVELTNADLNGEAVTVRLAVPSTTATKAKVTHKGSGSYSDEVFYADVRGSGSNQYVEIQMTHFSEVTVQLLGAISSTDVAAIGDTGYATLAAAIAAVPTDGTQTTITMIADTTTDVNTEISGNKNIILELNGKTISGSASGSTVNYYLLKIGSNANVTIQDTAGNGKITFTATNHDTGYSKEYSTVYNCGGTLTIKSGTIENATNGGAAYAVTTSSNAWDTPIDSTFNLEGGILTAPNGDGSLRVYQNNSKQYSKNTVNISGGTIKDFGLFVDTFYYQTGENVVVEINITGGKICGLVDLKLRHKTTVMNISGGEFGNVEFRVRKGSSPTYNVDYPDGAFVNITGGKFTFKSESDVFKKSYTSGSSDWDTYNPYSITGGYFNYSNIPVNDGYSVRETTDAEKKEQGSAYTYTVGVATTYVAQIGDTKYETLAAAAQAATSGQTIELLKDVANTGSVSLPAGVTLDGKNFKITGNSAIYINAAGGTITNVNFENNHNNDSKLSPVYGSGLTGTATITNCTFKNWDWDAIQITPAAATANIVITGNTFTAEAGENVHRGVHVQSSPTKLAFSANITGNKFYGVENLSETYLEVYDFTDASKVTVNGNYLDGIGGACILMNGYSSNVTSMALPLKSEALTTDVTTVAMVKRSGSTYNRWFYPTLANAIASTNAQIVYLTADDATDITLPVGMTFDTNGKTYSGTVSAPEGYIVKHVGTVYSVVAQSDAVASITTGETTTYYATIRAAITAANAGETVKLLKDIEVDSSSYPVVKKQLTIDLNNHNITSSYLVLYPYGADADVTLTGTGTLKTTSASDYAIYLYGGKLNIGENVKVVSEHRSGVAIFGMNNSATLVVNGTIEAAEEAIAGNGSTGYGGTNITINGTVKSTGTSNYAIYHPQAGTLTINGTVIGDGGICLKAGNATIDVNSTAVITANGTARYTDSSEATMVTGTIDGKECTWCHYSNGAATLGYAVVVENNKDYAGSSLVTIADGKITGKVAIYNDYGDASNYAAIPESKMGSISISGGHFSLKPDAAYIVEGKTAVADTEEMVTAGYNYTIGEIGDAVASITTGEGESAVTTYYATLEAALADCPNNASSSTTIKVLKDIALDAMVNVKDGKNVVIDLNNHTICHEGEKVITAYNCKLHITGTGSIEERVKDGYAPLVLVGSNEDVADYTVVTIDKDVTLRGDYSGIFIAKNSAGGYPNYGLVVNMAGTIELYDSSSSYDKDHGYGIYINGQNGQLDPASHAYSSYDNAVKINLNGAKIINNDVESTGIYAAGYGIWNFDNTTITAGTALSIKAGTFTFNSGSYTSTGEYIDPTTDNSDGEAFTGAALSLTSNSGYSHKIDVTVNGGTFTSTNGYAVYEGIPLKKGSTTEYVSDESYVTLAINGGLFKSAEGKDCVALTAMTDKKVITGGYFSTSASDREAFQTKYVAENYYAIANEETNKSTYPTKIGVTDEKVIVTVSSALMGADGTIDWDKTVATMSDGGEYTKNAKFAITAPTVDGYQFVGWYQNKVKACDTTTITLTATSDTTLHAVYISTQSSVSVNATTSGYGKVTYGASTDTTVSGTAKPGDNVTITATPAEGKRFAYWKNSYGKVISTNATYTTTAVQSVDVEAVFNNYGSATVVFKDGSGNNILGLNTYTNDEVDNITKVIAPSKMGSKFTGWTATATQTVVINRQEQTITEGQTLTDDQAAAIARSAGGSTVYVQANYQASGTYKIRVIPVIDGTVTSNEADILTITQSVGTPTAVTVDATSKLGVPFDHLEIDEQKISSRSFTVNPYAEKTYTCYAYYVKESTTNVTAYGSITVNHPTASYTNSEKIDLTMSWYLPEGATFVESGFYRSANATKVTEHDSTVKYKGTVNANSGSITRHVQMHGYLDSTQYCLAYVRYTFNNKTYTMYSSTIGTKSFELISPTSDTSALSVDSYNTLKTNYFVDNK